MASLLTLKLSKLAKAVAENLPKVSDAGAAALSGIPIRKSSPVSFRDFIRRISLCGCQDEIELTIQAELASMEQLLALPSAECTVRAQALSVAVYCHLLGYDVRFICIHAITLAQQGSLLQKRMGYLAVSLLLRPTDELAVLLVNTVLGDLRSGDVLVLCTGLNMVCHLVTADNAATFLPAVLSKLKHRQAVVRDKATRALHSLLLCSPELLPGQLEAVETALLDRDPLVMASAVQLCLTFAALNPAMFAHLTTSLMTILGQVQSRKLPPDFEHRGVPAPWLQCSLIRLISYLCPDDSGLADTFAQFLLSSADGRRPQHRYGLCHPV
ncbi:AP-4 complex subunit epsilon-1-like [Pollicipes pollicipes]|uniref:AP-4 complex subunit epsilon-1-like n=1 Tax=Pollicipes pollicipes TaxID=41117 RepID=UPI001884B992|nr:AP-4 complex subunit epsilon-1-like [Pollicipes pollicipes]